MNCASCGAELKPNLRFCTSCGSKVESSAQAAPPAAAPSGPPAGQTSPPVTRPLAPPMGAVSTPAPADTGFLDPGYQEDALPESGPTPGWMIGADEPEARPPFPSAAPPGFRRPEPDDGPPDRSFRKPMPLGLEQPNKFGFIAGLCYLGVVGAIFLILLLTLGPFFFIAMFPIFLPLIILLTGGLVCYYIAKGEPDAKRGFVIFATGILVPLLMVVLSGAMRGAVQAFKLSVRILPLQVLAGFFLTMGIVTLIASTYVIKSGVDMETHTHTRGVMFVGALSFLIGMFIPLVPGGGFTTCMAILPFNLLKTMGGMPLEAVLSAISIIIATLLLIVAGFFALTAWGDPNAAKLSYWCAMAAVHLPLVFAQVGIVQLLFSAGRMPFGFFIAGLGVIVVMLSFSYGTLYALIGGMADILGPAVET